MRLLAVVSLGIVIAWFASHETSLAHAAYAESSPHYAEELQYQPTEIVLYFTQELFRRMDSNTITVTHETGTKVEIGPAIIDNEQRKRLYAEVHGVMESGRYIVEWENLSAEDGDNDSGQFPFYLKRSPTEKERIADITLATEQLINFQKDTEKISLEPPSTESVAGNRSYSGKDTGAGRPSNAVIVIAVISVIAIAALIGVDRRRAR